MPELRHLALALLQESDPVRKAEGCRRLDRPELALNPEARWDEPPGLPGRPPRPVLVAPDAVPTRSPHTRVGRAALMHAIAHIEFNAINLALDALWRFPDLPPDYYRDWARVAREEAEHFEKVCEVLTELGHAYGDFEAHDGLWRMAWRTRHDGLARMALVPRTLEARGLDATPAIQAKLRQVGEAARPAVEVLDLILRDEIGHVAIGNRWYRWWCAREGLDARRHYRVLTERHGAPRPRPPFNLPARRAAGFTDSELQALEQDEETQPRS